MDCHGAAYGMSVTDETGSYRPPLRYVRTLHATETVTSRYTLRYTVHEGKQQVSSKIMMIGL